jgi:glycosyltransferase involved in cell wall biosynthesis
VTIFFFSSFFPDSQNSEIRKNSRGNIDNASDVLQSHIINGLKLAEIPVKVLNVPNIGSYPFFFKKYFFRGVQYRLSATVMVASLSLLNLPIIKNRFIVWQLVRCFNHLNSENNLGKKIIFVYGMSLPFLQTAAKLKTQYPGLKICLIIPDLPEFMNASSNWLMNLRLFIRPDIYRFLKKVDGFILLTRFMVDRLGINSKPWRVIEGMVNPEDFQFNNSKEVPNAIMYAGTLSKRYGIVQLLDAFNEIDDPSYELWICGGGDAHDLVSERVRMDTRIKFYGLLPRNETLKLMSTATLLVNPRSSVGEFTKYSFPSKTLEYMLSGKPIVMNKLPGIPDEYAKFIFFTSDESTLSLSKTIQDVCSLSKSERFEIGQKARQFVSEFKNYKIQTLKIIEMFQQVNRNS